MAMDKVVEMRLHLSDHQTTIHPSASPINQSINQPSIKQTNQTRLLNRFVGMRITLEGKLIDDDLCMYVCVCPGR